MPHARRAFVSASRNAGCPWGIRWRKTTTAAAAAAAAAAHRQHHRRGRHYYSATTTTTTTTTHGGGGEAAGGDECDHDDECDGGVSPPLVRLRSAVLRYPPPPPPPPSAPGPRPPPPSTIDDVRRRTRRRGGGNDENDDDGEEEEEEGEGEADRRRIRDHRRSSSQLGPFDMCVRPNLETPPPSSADHRRGRGGGEGGGHVALGRNGSGKTLLSLALARAAAASSSSSRVVRGGDGDHGGGGCGGGDRPSFLHSGELTMRRDVVPAETVRRRDHRFLSSVSFESHSELLRDESTTTVYRALIPGGGNRLSDTAKFLSVRLGMFPLLNRRVDTLSTGQVRRVLLVRALVRRPELLVLDNAFDGLDAEGREGLRDIVERVLRGFRMDILVQGIGDARDAARTQVLLLTHRPEEISGGFGRVTFLECGGGVGFEGRRRGGVRTENRMGRTGDELVRSLVLGDGGQSGVGGGEDAASAAGLRPWDVVLPGGASPSDVDVRTFWESGRGGSAHDAADTSPTREGGGGDVLVRSRGMTVSRDDVTLISRLNWTVRRGERWHLAGTNGKVVFLCWILTRGDFERTILFIFIPRVVAFRIIYRCRQEHAQSTSAPNEHEKRRRMRPRHKRERRGSIRREFDRHAIDDVKNPPCDGGTELGVDGAALARRS
jgi:ABC-type molybdenum transport system ATPase subunit/photorepair protein PhrA